MTPYCFINYLINLFKDIIFKGIMQWESKGPLKVVCVCVEIDSPLRNREELNRAFP